MGYRKYTGVFKSRIGKIAANFYQYELIKREQFTFSKVVAQMGASKKVNQQTNEE